MLNGNGPTAQSGTGNSQAGGYGGTGYGGGGGTGEFYNPLVPPPNVGIFHCYAGGKGADGLVYVEW